MGEVRKLRVIQMFKTQACAEKGVGPTAMQKLTSLDTLIK